MRHFDPHCKDDFAIYVNHVELGVKRFLVNQPLAQPTGGSFTYAAERLLDAPPNLHVLGEMAWEFPLGLPEEPLILSAGWLDDNSNRQGNAVYATLAQQSVFFKRKAIVPAGNLSYETCDGEELTIVPIWWASGPAPGDLQSQSFYFNSASGFGRSRW